MPKRIAISNLNASTMDILNTIRANAPYEYQQLVPVVETEADIPRVGEVLDGYPAMANQFINSLINRIASVRVRSATFNNAYAEMKKGKLEFGETVEEVFVSITKAREFSAEKAAAREFQRNLPDVRTAFHIMNWRVQYPVTIQNEDLRMAFTTINGVQDLIAKIVDAVYTAAEYDEYLLFKYLIIKAVSHGKMYPVKIPAGDMKNAAKMFRGVSNNMTFMKNIYNATGVTTATPKSDQYIFMDSFYNAEYDVDVLSAAFNMDKADFMGKLKLIDDFTTFDNDRFSVIKANSDMIEDITAEELNLMKGVKAVLVDKEWFQIYDNLDRFTEVYVSSGMYWNYNYNVWKTVSFSPFSNAAVFVADDAVTTLPNTIALNVVSVSEGDNGIAIAFVPESGASIAPSNIKFVQDETATTAGVGVHPYGAYIGADKEAVGALHIVAEINGTRYTSSGTIASTEYTIGNMIEITKQ